MPQTRASVEADVGQARGTLENIRTCFEKAGTGAAQQQHRLQLQVLAESAREAGRIGRETAAVRDSLDRCLQSMRAPKSSARESRIHIGFAHHATAPLPRTQGWRDANHSGLDPPLLRPFCPTSPCPRPVALNVSKSLADMSRRLGLEYQCEEDSGADAQTMFMSCTDFFIEVRGVPSAWTTCRLHVAESLDALSTLAVTMTGESSARQGSERQHWTRGYSRAGGHSLCRTAGRRSIRRHRGGSEVDSGGQLTIPTLSVSSRPMRAN